jgi:hypothetical protein
LLRKIAKDYNNAGVKCFLRQADSLDAVVNRTTTGQFDAIFSELNDRQILADNANFWTTRGGFNLAKFSNMEVDRLFLGLNDPKSDDAKTKLRLQSIIREETPTISLFYRVDYGAIRTPNEFKEFIIQDPFNMYYLSRDR